MRRRPSSFFIIWCRFATVTNHKWQINIVIEMKVLRLVFFPMPSMPLVPILNEEESTNEREKARKVQEIIRNILCPQKVIDW